MSSFITTYEAWMLRQTMLGLCPRLVSKKSTLGKYLALNSLVTIASWLVINFQPWFLSIDKLKA